jgi:hypothetical protein
MNGSLLEARLQWLIDVNTFDNDLPCRFYFTRIKYGFPTMFEAYLYRMKSGSLKLIPSDRFCTVHQINELPMTKVQISCLSLSEIKLDIAYKFLLPVDLYYPINLFTNPFLFLEYSREDETSVVSPS